jgi:hypothetical protein
MLRKIIDYKKLSHELADLLIETYPDGYGDDDIIKFRNISGELVEAVELQTSDTLYLIKISKSLSNFIANFDDSIEKELDTKTKVAAAGYDEDEEDDYESEELEMELNMDGEMDDDDSDFD